MANLQETQPDLHLLRLPYDIRHLVYKHLFPTSPQLYIIVAPPNTNAATMPKIKTHTKTKTNSPLEAILLLDHSIPTALLLTCHQMHLEAGEHLYNSYLFNLIGTKADCLTHHTAFLETLRKYARKEVRVDAFGNGAHSATMCISMQAGESKMEILRQRGRGERIADLAEFARDESITRAIERGSVEWRIRQGGGGRWFWWVGGAVGVVMAVLMAVTLGL